MKHILFTSSLVLGLALVAAPVGMAHADGLYRCVVDGVPTYTSKRLSKACKSVSHAPPPPSKPYLPLLEKAAKEQAEQAASGNAPGPATAGQQVADAAPAPVSTPPRGLPPLPPGQ